MKAIQSEYSFVSLTEFGERTYVVMKGNKEYIAKRFTKHEHDIGIVVHGERKIGQKYLIFEKIPFAQALGNTMNGSWSLNIAGPVLYQYAANLCYLESKKIVHGDINPWNLIMGKDMFYIVDFGSSAKINKNGIARTKDIFPKTASPENYWLGFSRNNSDVYSLGAVMYACLHKEGFYALKSPRDRALALGKKANVSPHVEEKEIFSVLSLVRKEIYDKILENYDFCSHMGFLSSVDILSMDHKELQKEEKWQKIISSMVEVDYKNRPTATEVKKRLEEIIYLVLHSLANMH